MELDTRTEASHAATVATRLIEQLRIRENAIMNAGNPPVPSLRAFWYSLENLPNFDDDRVRVLALELTGFMSHIEPMSSETLGRIAAEGVSITESRRSGKTSVAEISKYARVFMGTRDNGRRRLIELAGQVIAAEMFDILRRQLSTGSKVG